MIICYSGRSRPSAEAILDALGDMGEVAAMHRNSNGDINWGRSWADTALNPDISNSTNKRVMRELFAENEVPMPRLFDANEDILLFENGLSTVPGDETGKVSWPIVGRPDNHTKGRGFWLCNDHADVTKALRGTRKKKAATHFMEFIDAPHEYRVHIFLGKSIRISEKKFDENGYTTIKPTGEITHVRKAAKAAVAALGLDFGAVDILATDDDCWVLEVNAAPGLGGTMPKLYAETFKKWYEENL